ncbi:LPS-assembly protein [Rhizomicrobium palustre]|uniref:LPS-assembly protein LptD n=1 Tax=Rhizomicrobium palustre TaxID=189966 RepID=A0A846MV92_9PROT|nr:LPS assembly protein LptD [Rhizomicrobium palustre]NIK87022.1 LPS-assembly protein [Rhizomicrobium palustre]
MTPPLKTLLRRILLGGAAITALTLSAAAAEERAPAKDMLLQADKADYDSKAKRVIASGHVEIDYDGSILIADKVSYDQNTDVVTADGNVTVMDKTGNVAFAKHVVLKDKLREGALTGFGALLGSHGRLVAASAERKEGGRITIANHVAYTPCKICQQDGSKTPVWQIKAVRVVHDNEKHRVKFTDATLAVFGIPIFYTPILTEPDPTVHHSSGFLLPDVGNSSANGYFISIPYYWSISPSRDATLQSTFTTKGGQVLEGEYRERWNDGGMWLQGSVAHTPNGGTSQDQTQYYSHLFGSGRAKIAENWTLGYDAQLTSNDTYLKRYNISQLDRLVSDLFVSGEQGQSRFALSSYFFQGLRASDDNHSFAIPLPLIEYTYIPMQKLAGGRFRLDVNSVSLYRQSGANNQRVTAEASWRFPLVTQMGQLWTFQINARGDVYHTDTPLDGDSSHYATRAIPYMALDWRWPFIANRGGGHSILLEPIAQVIAQPYGGNFSNVQNEDSLNVELDENNLLSFDQVPGYDLVVSGPRANFGLRAEMRFDSGYAEALIGQAYRLHKDPGLSDISGSGFTDKHSDLVGRFSLKFPPYLDLTNRLDIDEQTGNVSRDEVYVTGTLGRSSVRVSYVQLSAMRGVPNFVEPDGQLLPARQEITAQMDVNFYRNWQAFAAIRRDLKAEQTLDNEFGLGYEDECLGISLGYRRKYTTDRDLRPSTSYILRIKLKTTETTIQPFSLFPQDVFSYGRP